MNDENSKEEYEIDMSSEEAVTFAYKNIIFSVIQICKSINSGNSDVILNEMLGLVENASNLPGFDSLSEVKRFQDIFKLGYSVFKNDG